MMTRQEHLEFCKRCTNRSMDANHGIVCSLTGKVADFEETCEHFTADSSVEMNEEAEEAVQAEEAIPVTSLPEHIQSEYRQYQNLPYALVGGIFLTFITAVLWAAITVSTEYQIGWMAVGAGFIVGMGIRFFGAGVDPVYRYVGAFYALLACLLGNYFSQIGFIAQYEGISYFQTMKLIDLAMIPELFMETSSPMDLFFYALAIYEGFKFSLRPITELETQKIIPSLNNARFPAIIAGFVVLGLLGFAFNGTEASMEDLAITPSYENGQSMWEGSYIGNFEDGEWKYFYENGNVSISGAYESGRETGEWTYFNEDGSVLKTVGYKNGLQDGWQISYFDNGTVADSTQYQAGRESGKSKTFYENGEVLNEGSYNRGKLEGPWTYYYSSGNIASQGEYQNNEPTGEWLYYNSSGALTKKSTYSDGDEFIMWAAGDDGKEYIVDGNGHMIHYDDLDRKISEVDIREGQPSGKFTAYDSIGQITYQGDYENNKLRIRDAWDVLREHIVQNGYGDLTLYYPSGVIMEQGELIDGLKQGEWNYFYESGILAYTINYENDELNGPAVYYNEDGSLLTEGSFSNDKQSGTWKWFYANGNVESELTFENGVKVGAQQRYSENGYHVLTEQYTNGELVNEIVEPISE